MKTSTNKILITGATGFLGQHLEDELRDSGYKNIEGISSNICDLRIQEDVNNYIFTSNPNIVIHCAATVGGIGANRNNPGQFCYENLIMGANLIEACRKYCEDIKKFVLIGTVCSYGKYTPIPFKEDSLFDGYPEETNAYYGIAKSALMVLLQSYRKQYDFPGITLLPVNMYGTGDSLNIKTNHVIPAMIIKFLKAKHNNLPEVILWGTGNPTREFLYVNDCAKAICLAMERYDDEKPVNIGTGKEIKMRDLAELIAQKIEYEGKITWDYVNPDGQPRRCLDVSRAKEFGFEATTSLNDGLDKTIEWIRNKIRI